jgi:hypothetical protein
MKCGLFSHIFLQTNLQNMTCGQSLDEQEGKRAERVKMGRYWGLRGRGLNAAIWLLAMFAIMGFGFNQAGGGILTNKSFNKQFPQMDTIDTTGNQKHYNSTIQGLLI